MKRWLPALFLTTLLGCAPGIVGETPSDGLGSHLPGVTGTGNPPGTTGTGNGTGVTDPGTTTTTGTAMGGLPCAVQSFLQTRCQGCHSSPPQNGAPFPLVSYADAVAYGPSAVTSMQNGLMPLGGPPATPAEIQLMSNWIAAGSPMGPGNCGGSTTTGTGTTGTGTTGTGTTGTGTTGTGTGTGTTGTGTTGTGTTTGTTTNLFCAVTTLMKARCQGCHSSPPVNGAPFALVSYSDLLANASLAVSAMKSGAMPLGGPVATAAEIATVQNWINAGFPNTPCAPATSGTGGTTGTTTGGTGGSTGTTGGTGGSTGTTTGGTGGSTGTTTTGTGGSTGTTTPPPTTSILPCAVQTLMVNRCQGCHSSPPKNGAPFSLVSYTDVRTNAALALSAMQSGAMPLGGPVATSTEIATLQSWINSGFPSGPACTTPPPPPPPPPPPTTPPPPPPPPANAVLPCTVQTLVVTRCQGCHSSPPKNGAPFALVSYSDVRNNASAALAAMQSGAMPLGGPRATTTEIAIIQNWISGGFASGPACAVPPVPPTTPPPDDGGGEGGGDNGGEGGGGNSGKGSSNSGKG